MQDVLKVVWSIPYVSVASFFPSLKQNFIAYHSSKVSSSPDCIFEIHQLWQSGFSRVYSNCYCSCSFEPEIIKIGQSSHKMYSNNIVNFQESMTILNAGKKKSGNLLNTPRIKYIYGLLTHFVDNILKWALGSFLHIVEYFHVLLYNSHILASVICLHTVLFDLLKEPHQVLPLQVSVDLGAMAMKGYSISQISIVRASPSDCLI